MSYRQEHERALHRHGRWLGSAACARCRRRVDSLHVATSEAFRGTAANAGSVTLCPREQRHRVRMLGPDVRYRRTKVEELHIEIERRLEHARRIEVILQRLGWFVAMIGVVGIGVFIGFWIADELSAEQAVSLVLGTMLATVLSGASAYGAGVNIGLGAARLEIAARSAAADVPTHNDSSFDGNSSTSRSVRADRPED